MKHLLFIAAMCALAFTSCGSKGPDSRTLVLYYSQTGTTETVAQEIRKNLNADLEIIKLEKPYTGTYRELVEQVGKEREGGILPKLLPLTSDLSKYDTIFLGYPIWYGTYATPVASLVKEYGFEGKQIVTFCTFGSGGLEPAIRDLKEALPKAEIAEQGFGIRTARIEAAAKELNRFLIENNYIEGSVEPLPGYSEMQPVTEEEKKIFDAACGDYQYPLGTPVTVGKRNTSDGIDYIFKVESHGGTSTIYVTAGNNPDSKPEFTRVVRQ